MKSFKLNPMTNNPFRKREHVSYFSNNPNTSSRIVGAVEPDTGNHEIYDELYGIYRELYPATREASHAFADLQR